MKEGVDTRLTALSGRRVRSVDVSRRRGTRVVRKLGVAVVAGAVSLFSGGIVGHALTISTTTLTSAPNPSVWGQSVTFTATITPVSPAPTGTVTFQDGGVNVAGCVNKTVSARVATCATAALAVGSHTITAVYSGNATYSTSTSSLMTQVVNMGSTLTALASSVNPSVSGQTVTYTVTVTAVAPAAGTRTGTVDFQDGGVDIAGCGAKAVSAAGTATCAVAYAGPGTHAITAVYSGDADYTGSTAPGLTQTVNLGATAVALTSSVNPSSTGANVTFTANVTATAPASGTRTGTVNFEVGGVTIAGCGAQAVPASGKATCVTNTLPVGANTITAVYSGDPNFAPSASATLTQTVNQGATTTKVVSSLNPSTAGVAVTFTATVTATAPAVGVRTGTVAFEDGGVVIAACAAQLVAAAGTATCVTSVLGAGVHTITAVYSGDPNFTTSTSAPLTQTVLSTTTTTVVSSANPSVFGQGIVYTASVVGGPTVTGTITFRDGGSNIAGCVAVPMIAGSASCAVSPTVASHTITAVYSGDPSNAASTSAAMTQVVTADPTTTVLTVTLNPTVFGQSVTFTAVVTANAPGSGTPTGKIAFDNGASAIGGCGSVTLTAGVATCTTAALTTGVHSITAVYNGSSSYATSTSSVLTETVNFGATTIVVGSSVNPSVSGQPVTYTATVTVNAPAAGTPTGKINFEDGGVTIAGCGAKALAAAGTASCSFTYAGAGIHLITAVYTGDSNFGGSTSPNFTQTVNPASTSTTVASSLNPTVAGQAVTLTAIVSVVAPGVGTRTGSMMFEDGGVTITGCAAQPVSAAGSATCPTAFATAGSHPITAVYGGDANFNGSTSAALAQNVNQGATATALSSSTNPSVSGETVLYTAIVTALAPASGTPTGTAGFMDGATTISGCSAQPLIGGVASCSLAYAGPGSHAITAIYSGDSDFTASTSPVLTQNINQGATATAVSSSVNPSVSGQPVTYTAVVSAGAPAAGTPTGTATFMDRAATIAGCSAQPLVGGVALCGVTYAGPGSHAITVIYNGDPDFTGSTTPVLTQTINPAVTSTSLVSSVNPSVSGQPVSFIAAVSVSAPGSGTPTGTVAFLDGGTTIAGCASQAVTVAGLATCGVTFPGAGTSAITAINSGDASFTASSSTVLAQTINPASTSTSLVSSVNPSVTGQSVTITATVSVTAPGAGVPTGTVAFLDGGTTIAACASQAVNGAGLATCDLVFVAPSVEDITAVYGGDLNFDGSTSAVLTQNVNQGATATSTTSSVNPSVSGQPVTYTAVVSASAPAAGTPTGTATFMDGAATIAGCSAQPLVGGVASCGVIYGGPGSHAITVIYNGDPDFTGSTTPVLTQTINPAVTSTSLVSSVNPSVTGQLVSFTAAVIVLAPGTGTPTGTVAFLDGGTTIAGCASQAVNVAGIATCDLVPVAPDVEDITAVYGGDANFNGSTSAALTQTVNQGATATALSSSPNPSVSGETVLYTAVVTALAPASGTPTGTAGFMDGATTIGGCSAQPLIGGVASCNVSYVGSGSHAITAIYSGDPDFTGSTSPVLTQTIDPASTSTSTTSSVNPSVTGQSVTFTATVSFAAPGGGVPTGTVAFVDGGTTVTGCAAQPIAGDTASCTVAFALPGAPSITATYSGDANFTGSVSPALLQNVDAAESVTTLTSPASVWAAGQPGIFIARVSALLPAKVTPSGTAAFMDAGAPIPGCAARPVVAGTASCSAVYTDAGAHTITAVYSGDAAVSGSTSPTFVLSIYDDPPTPDTGATAATPAPWVYVVTLGGAVLVFVLACVRLRRRGSQED